MATGGFLTVRTMIASEMYGSSIDVWLVRGPVNLSQTSSKRHITSTALPLFGTRLLMSLGIRRELAHFEKRATTVHAHLTSTW